MSTNKDIELYKPLIDEDVEEQPLKTPAFTQAKKTQRGCPCWCKCVLIVLALFVTLNVMFVACVYMGMKDVVEHLTVTTPHAKFPVVDMTDKELQAVEDRVKLFVDELILGHHHEMKPLVITQDEINGFIGHSDYLRGNMFVSLKEGRIDEEYSLPTEMLPGGRGRYFVGSDYTTIRDGQMEFQLETAATHHDWFDGPLLFAQLQYLVSDKDLLELYLTKGSFFGQQVPQEYIDQHENLLQGLYDDPDAEDARAVLEGIDRVRIEKGKLVFEPKIETVKEAVAIKEKKPMYDSHFLKGSKANP